MKLELFERAMVVLKTCMGVEPDQQVLVVEDGSLSPRVTEAFVYAANAIGANALIMTYQPGHFISMREYGLFAGASMGRHHFRLPQPLLRAMEASDIVMILNSDMEMLFDESFRALLRGDRKMGWIPYLDEDSFLRLLPESAQEARELYEVSTRIGKIFTQSKQAIVQSDAGTDVHMNIGDYPTNCAAGTWDKEYRRWVGFPGGQIATMPNAGTARGRVVIDRSVSAPEFKELLDPIDLTVENGYVTRIAGGIEAKRLERFLASLDDGGEAYHLTELGVGTNRRCKVAGVAGPAEDTHTLGTVSLALGADIHLGGETVAGCHVDMTMRFPTLKLDGRVVVDRGQLVV